MHDLLKGIPLENGPPGLTVKTRFFDLQRTHKDEGSFILEAPNDFGTVPRRLQIGSARLSIHQKENTYQGFIISPRSAVLWDIHIFYDEHRLKGTGLELLVIMEQYAKSRKSKRFYAWNVQPQAEGFFVKADFVRTYNQDWWILKDF
jgi:hypothetical protein